MRKRCLNDFRLSQLARYFLYRCRYGQGVARPAKQTPGRYDDIVAATIDFIIESGVGRLRATDIAKRLGISSGLIFYHFDTLENLTEVAFTVAAERDLAELQKTLTAVSGQPAIGRLRAVFHQYGLTGSGEGWRLWIESWSAALREPKLRSVVSDLTDRWRQAVATIIAEGVGSGEFTTADVHGATRRLISLLDGLSVQMVALDGSVTSEEVDALMAAAMQMELGLAASSA